MSCKMYNRLGPIYYWFFLTEAEPGGTWGSYGGGEG